MSYAPPERWDRYFRGLRDAGGDLDWRGEWTAPFLAPLRAAGARTVLELGCGTGHDAARLAREGFTVIALDFSREAIVRARTTYGAVVAFVVADMARPFGFPDAAFDAVMANVAVHMFSDTVTRAVFAEVARVVRPGGLFLFHVNALEDRPLRARRFPVVRELEPDYVREATGQTMHFFSEPYLRDLLAGWRDLHLELIEIPDGRTGEPFKCVWRGIADR